MGEFFNPFATGNSGGGGSSGGGGGEGRPGKDGRGISSIKFLIFKREFQIFKGRYKL